VRIRRSEHLAVRVDIKPSTQYHLLMARMRMQWTLTKDGDPRGRVLADRHYSRIKPGAKLFVHPARKLVLIRRADQLVREYTPWGYYEGADAVWATTWPFAEYVLHRWAGPFPYTGDAKTLQTRYVERFNKKTKQKEVVSETPGTWCNALFRNESGVLSSALIRQAVAATRAEWGEPPPFGMVTMVWSHEVREKRDVGRAYLAAGFTHVGRTKVGDKEVFLLAPQDMPPPRAARKER
jgi:hypothetical protein